MSPPTCPGCYQSDYDGSWWCDNCELWPCVCGDAIDWDAASERIRARICPEVRTPQARYL